MKVDRHEVFASRRFWTSSVVKRIPVIGQPKTYRTGILLSGGLTGHACASETYPDKPPPQWEANFRVMEQLPAGQPGALRVWKANAAGLDSCRLAKAINEAQALTRIFDRASQYERTTSLGSIKSQFSQAKGHFEAGCRIRRISGSADQQSKPQVSGPMRRLSCCSQAGCESARC